MCVCVCVHINTVRMHVVIVVKRAIHYQMTIQIRNALITYYKTEVFYLISNVQLVTLWQA